eukprot:1359925-Rhodomonas_salina.1
MCVFVFVCVCVCVRVRVRVRERQTDRHRHSRFCACLRLRKRGRGREKRLTARQRDSERHKARERQTDRDKGAQCICIAIWKRGREQPGSETAASQSGWDHHIDSARGVGKALRVQHSALYEIGHRMSMAGVSTPRIAFLHSLCHDRALRRKSLAREYGAAKGACT